MRFLVCLATVPFEKPFEINMQKKGADTQFYWWTFARKINSVLYQPLWNTQSHVYITRNKERNWMMRITWHESVLTHRLKDEQRNYLLIGSKVFWSANSCQNWHKARLGARWEGSRKILHNFDIELKGIVHWVLWCNKVKELIADLNSWKD